MEMEEDIDSWRKCAKRVERFLNEKDREVGQLHPGWKSGLGIKIGH